MSTSGDTEVIAIVAGADLRAAQYKAVAVGGTIAANNTDTIGLLQNKPNTGEGASLAYAGHMKGVAGAALTAGNRVKVTTSGYLAVVASGDGSCGKVLTTCTSGSTVEILADFVGAATTY